MPDIEGSSGKSLRAAPSASPAQATVRRRGGWSWAWLLPPLAAAIVGYAVWKNWKVGGPSISLHFQDGHGLREGDLVRHRGIVVGQVKQLRLDKDLAGVEVDIRLEETSADLARSGSLFWIVRPTFGWGGIGGLDTLAGARYIGVLPGLGVPREEFQGLEDIPITALCPPGSLEIIIQAPTRGGIRPASIVTYRQLTIGRVVSTGLSNDASAIEVRVDIDPPFAGLIREKTCFWETSGISLKIGLKDGLKVGFDSPEALVSGAIALATPPQAGEAVSTGHHFSLQPEPKDEWMAWQPALAVGDTIEGQQLPRPLATTISWKRKELLRRQRSYRGWTLAVPGGLLGPASLVRADKAARDGSLELQVAGSRFSVSTAPAWEERGIAVLHLELGLGADQIWPLARMRAPAAPEDCLAVGDPAIAPLALAAARISADGIFWRIDPVVPIDASWHGAAVVSRSDGQLIGVLMLDGEKAIISPLADPKTMFGDATVPAAAPPAP